MTIWFSSDPHFGHGNLVNKFKLKSGAPARSFASVEEMDETMIRLHNEKVKPSDHWYCLGDVSMKQQDMDRVLPRLNGHKRLVRGNHDIFKTKHYLKYFDEIHGTRLFDGLLFSHIPIAPWSFGRHVKANVHGHVHMSLPLTYRVVDPMGESGFCKTKLYINISLERTHYRPVSLEELQQWVRLAEHQ
jgi:calcineurin-like phosphoesterase family protein